MSTYAERAAEKRRVTLEDFQRKVKDGSLKIRKMTAQERRRFPAVPAKARRKWRASSSPASNRGEGAPRRHTASCASVRCSPPVALPGRGGSLSWAVASTDRTGRSRSADRCPRGGNVVAAILDHRPFEAFCVHTDDGGESAPARVSHPVYSATEFSWAQRTRTATLRSKPSWSGSPALIPPAGFRWALGAARVGQRLRGRDGVDRRSCRAGRNDGRWSSPTRSARTAPRPLRRDRAADTAALRVARRRAGLSPPARDWRTLLRTRAD